MIRTPRIPAEFVGMTTQQLQVQLQKTQQAIADLSNGAKVEVAGYAQGDGNKNVTFTKADLGTLQQRVQMLAGILYPGQGYGRRRPLRPLFIR